MSKKAGWEIYYELEGKSMKIYAGKQYSREKVEELVERHKKMFDDESNYKVIKIVRTNGDTV